MVCMERSRGVGLLILGIVALASIGCQSMRDFDFISLEPELWRADLDGEVQFTDLNILGTNIDLGNLLNLEQRENTVVFRGAFRVVDVVIEARYFSTTYDGSTTLTQDITFLGQTFTISSDIESTLDLELANVHAKFGFGKPPLVLGAILGVNYIDVEAKIKSLNPIQVTLSDEIDVPFPVVGATASLTLPLDSTSYEDASLILFADLEVTGLFVDVQEIAGKFVDGSARAGLRIGQWFSVGAGYRYFDVDFEDDNDNKASVQLEGPFVFGAISF